MIRASIPTPDRAADAPSAEAIAKETVRKYIKLGVRFIVGPNVYAGWMENDIARALDAFAQAAVAREREAWGYCPNCGSADYAVTCANCGDEEKQP